MTAINAMAHPKPRDRVSTVDLRDNLRSLRHRATKGEVIPVYLFESLVGYLVTPSKTDELNLINVKDYKAVDFRKAISQIAETLLSGEVDCAYVLFHSKRRVLAFVRREAWDDD